MTTKYALIIIMPFVFNSLFAQKIDLIYTTPTECWVQANNATVFKMQERYLKAYALYFSKFVQTYKKKGIPLFAIMPQNEILKSSKGKNHLAFHLKDGRTILLVNNPEETSKTLNVMYNNKPISVQINPKPISTLII
ncbi:hypothetical protein Q4Q35_18525 [Flavivirga aquimarina]|uniref:Glycosyl hydrolase family 30 beta sandwich domain-containing protein n=1 Tax=Flavivirga aquimarina TaxID=2027862 RepID=A0ABT8WFN4_9FLAO|nr:hypothetical protein [Flavivirga aquimarina]MDO5971802.1 hypothetical protein [Flavivirga aquimarina]